MEAWQPARLAPAERERRGIRALPGPKDFPRVSRFIKSETRKGQLSPAGGMEVRAPRGPTRRGVLFFWTGRGPFSFRQDRKENGGRVAASNLALPRATTGRPYTPPERAHLPGHRHGPCPVPSDAPPSPSIENPRPSGRGSLYFGDLRTAVHPPCSPAGPRLPALWPACRSKPDCSEAAPRSAPGCRRRWRPAGGPAGYPAA